MKLLHILLSMLFASAAPPATEPSASASPTVTLKLESAVPSNQVEHDDWELSLPSQLPFKDRPLLFGDVATFDDDDKATASIPIVAYKHGDSLLTLKIEDPRLKNASWAYIASGPAKDELWGVLDASTDDKQLDLVLVHSTDAGSTLALTSIPKPHPAAVFDSFCMDKDGHGRVSMYVYRDQARLKHAGYYHYRTNDGGKTWSAADHEPDAMTPATDAPDEPLLTPEKPSKA